jgi:hypothetical protein
MNAQLDSFEMDKRRQTKQFYKIYPILTTIIGLFLSPALKAQKKQQQSNQYVQAEGKPRATYKLQEESLYSARYPMVGKSY